MSLSELFAGGGIGLLVLLSLVQVAPIKVNPWSTIAAIVGKALNGELLEKVDKLGDEVTSLQSEVVHLREEMTEAGAVSCRTRIVRFGDEILHGIKHSKEHFDQILIDISTYENYCDTHRAFRNDVTRQTVERIRSVYQNCLKDNSFL